MSRIRTILHKLVSLCQSAFIPRRCIAKNEIIIHEILYSFKLRRVKDGLMAVKLDLQKAYNKINWSFLRNLLQKFGFADVFINWIMECISTVSLAIIINGVSLGCLSTLKAYDKGTHCPRIYSFFAKRSFRECRIESLVRAD